MCFAVLYFLLNSNSVLSESSPTCSRYRVQDWWIQTDTMWWLLHVAFCVLTDSHAVGLLHVVYIVFWCHNIWSVLN